MNKNGDMHLRAKTKNNKKSSKKKRPPTCASWTCPISPTNQTVQTCLACAIVEVIF